MDTPPDPGPQRPPCREVPPLPQAGEAGSRRHVVLTTKGVKVLSEEEFRIFKLNLTPSAEEKRAMAQQLIDDFRRKAGKENKPE
jgi:hypothetical protein